MVPLFAISCATSPGELQALIERAATPPGWVVESTNVNPPRIPCFSGKCGEAHVRWTVPAPTGGSEVMEAFGPILGPLTFEAGADCKPRPNGDMGAEVSCAASVDASGHSLRAVLRGPADAEKSVDLYITVK